MKNKKKILVIVVLILLGLAAVLLAGSEKEKTEETALPEKEVVQEHAEHLEETTEETTEALTEEQETSEEQEISEEEETDVPQEMVTEDAQVQEEPSEEKEDTPAKREDSPVKKEDASAQNGDSAMLSGGIKVCEIGNYIGSYVEDGSDEFVDNMMMVVLENRGSEYIQLAKVKINDQYLFEVTTLFPGEKVMVLEKNRAEYVEDLKITSTEIFDVGTFSEPPTMCEDILKIETKDGMINVENISGKEFPGGKVFFKTVLEDKYLGGITYFSTIPKLEKGKGVKLAAGHFEEGRSEMLFVTHAE